jgi:subtilisin family serine protease
MRKSMSIAAIAVSSATLVAAASAAGASPGRVAGAPGPGAARFAKIDPALLAGAAERPGGPFVPASISNRPVSVILQLTGAPVAVRDAQAKGSGRGMSQAEKTSLRAQLRARQDALHGRLAAAGARVVGQMQDAYNGIQVIAPQRAVPGLATLPGVIAVHAVPTVRPANVNGVPFIGGPQAWNQTDANGNHLTGQGVDVAIIDTGIDYTHADFGGPGTVAAWNDAKAHSTDPPDPALVGPAAPKVKKGFDFVGDDYNADVPAHATPQPDPNPLDCNDHGTHTAGTLAGFGVTSDGKTFTGPYDATTVTSHTWNVGPGVAPKANLFVYRVFGCTGSSNVVTLAINQAVKDGAQVISMSLGSDFGSASDPTAVASQNAVDDGIAVVAAAGNAGNNAYVVGSPATANGVLAAAAIDGSTPTLPGATLSLSTGSTVSALDANGVTIPNVTLPVKVLKNPDGSIALGCDKSDYAGTAGDLVVTMRGTCARVARAVFGDEAGAAAVVMVNTDNTFPPFEGDITQDPDTGEQHQVTIPFLGVRASDGPALLAADGGTVTLAPAQVTNPGYKVAANFSSGGPRNPDSAPKPDVIAPGVSVVSAGMGTGTGSLVDSGTSMATPMTAGTAALVKQAHPDWTGREIKAAIMNTADPSLNLGYNSRLAGTGVVQAQAAVDATVLATTGDGLDALAFGYVPGSGDYSDQKTITLTNGGDTAQSFDITVSANSGQLGASVTATPSSVSVPAHGTASVHVALSIPATAFAALPSDDTFAVGPGALLNLRGVVVATPAGGGTALRVPYLVAPRGLSDVRAGVLSGVHRSGNAVTASIPLTNGGVHSGLADLYTWGITDPNEGGSTMDVRDAGAQVLPGSAFGVPDTDRGLVFLINTWSRSSTQAVNEYDVDIDTNGDGKPDFVVAGVDLGLVTAGAADGVYASFTIDVATGSIVDAFFADAPMNGSTIELPALAGDLGLTGSPALGGKHSTVLGYTVAAFSLIDGSVDTTGTAVIDPFHPALSSGDNLTLDPAGTASLAVTVDRAQLRKTPALGWLVATIDDANGAPQADQVAAP